MRQRRILVGGRGVIAARQEMRPVSKHAQAIKCSWGRYQPSQEPAPPVPPAYATLPGGEPAGGMHHMYSAVGVPALLTMPEAWQPGMYAEEAAQGGSAYLPQRVCSVSAFAACRALRLTFCFLHVLQQLL